MKAIDKKSAQLRIMKAFVQGHVDTYGHRRFVEVEQEFMASPGHVFKADEKYIDGQGVERTGRFVPLPPTKQSRTLRKPEGVIVGEMALLARANVDAFMEVLNIMEEALGKVPEEEACETIQVMREAAGG